MTSGADVGRAEPNSAQRFSLREAARILEVPEARLRALARAGLLTSQRGPIGPLSFGFQDLLLLRTTKGLLESGVPMRQIRRIWVSLRKQLSAELPLTVCLAKYWSLVSPLVRVRRAESWRDAKPSAVVTNTRNKVSRPTTTSALRWPAAGFVFAGGTIAVPSVMSGIFTD